jgi:carboxypeptidase C (cathepsin A)
MWSQIAVVLCFVLHANTQLKTPLSLGTPPYTHIKSSSVPSLGAPTLGDSFIKFAASHVDVSAAKAFNPIVTSLNKLKEDTFTKLTHPAYPKHGVRVKKSKFCDGTVDAYTGYVDVEARHIFFSFFKSRNDWTKDPVMVCARIEDNH